MIFIIQTQSKLQLFKFFVKHLLLLIIALFLCTSSVIMKVLSPNSLHLHLVLICSYI